MVATLLAGFGLAVPAPSAGAAGIVTHAWMALDAIDHVGAPDLHAVLDAHRDQVRAGAEFPDGGYWTRTFGTPGGDYGEEAHWQRYVDAAVDQIRADATCGDLAQSRRPVRGEGRAGLRRGRATAWATRCGTGCSSPTDRASARTTCRRNGPGSSVRAGSRRRWTCT